jgi:DNA-binding NarL/FixJ family response regulator
MITVCIATDVSLIREGLLRILNEERGILVTMTASHSDHVLRSCRSGSPEVLLLDIALPGEGTAALLRRMKQRGCTRSIILFGDWDAENVVAALRLQVPGMLCERDDAENFVRAVHLVNEGLTFVSNSVQDLIQADASPPATDDSSIDTLFTPTELQIFHALADNATSQEIARKMFISYRTVQKHRSNMARKLKLEGSNALLAFALRHRQKHT